MPTSFTAPIEEDPDFTLSQYARRVASSTGGSPDGDRAVWSPSWPATPTGSS